MEGFSPLVQLGMRYKRAFFDFSHSADYSAITKEQDLSGMMDFQKYRLIYEKYQHCYGEEFLRADAIDYPVSYSEDDPYTLVIERFRSEVSEVCGGETAVKEAKRDAYYGGLTDEQVRQAVIGSYDTSDGLTFRELYDISYDIWSVGLDGGFHFRLDDLFADYSEGDTAFDANLKREEMLDKKVTAADFDRMQRFYDSCVSDVIMMPPDYMETLSAVRAAVKM